MNIVIDARPSAELTDEEIVAYWFQTLRTETLQTGVQALRAGERLFPDLAPERRAACLKRLIQVCGGSG